MDSGYHVLRFTYQPSDARGGVSTVLLVGKALAAVNLTIGVTSFPIGTAIPLHHHNCAEQLTVLEGEAEAEICGEKYQLGPLDTTLISAEKPHRFSNVGNGPMSILWIYGSAEVTRTITETRETVTHLSNTDTGATRDAH